MRTYTSEQIHTAFQTAPQAIRDVFLSQETGEIVYQLEETYKLHVDVAGELGAQVGYLLLGLSTPAELFGNLVLEGTDEKTARAVLEEINTRIFLPLREKMRGQSTPTPPVTMPTYTAPAAPLFEAPVQQPVIITPEPQPAPRPIPAPAPTPVPASVVETPASEPQIRTMAHDMESAKNHVGAQTAIPSAWSNPPTPPVPIQNAFPIQPTARKIETVVQEPPLEKTYGMDPYREPVQ